MRAISFKLSGKSASFRKPDVNQYAYFTYNNIHKPALLGLLGALVGFGGYTQLFEENRGLKEEQLGYNSGYPEFYERLKNLKISIAPLAPQGYFSKKIQVFNNSVGYASFEAGGNLIVREQWLENPSWQILILDDGSVEFVKIKEYLSDKKAVYIPYLGKNDHPASIDEVKDIELAEELIKTDDGVFIDSLFLKEENLYLGWERGDELGFLFQEVSPIALQKEYHFYEYETLIFTNRSVEPIPKSSYSDGRKNYTFI